MSIEALDPGNAADVDAVAGLHEAHLGDSPIVLLGPKFLRQFYYRKIVEDELIRCLVYRIDGRMAAFLSYTKYPDDFMSRSVKAHFPLLSWIMFKTLLGSPKTVKHVLAAFRIMNDRTSGQRPASSSGTAEAISMVVLPEYQKHIPPGGKSRLTVRLFETMAENCRKEGMERVLFLVKPENRASNIFFNAIGCDFEKLTHFGLPVHRYTYHLNGPPR